MILFFVSYGVAGQWPASVHPLESETPMQSVKIKE